MFIPPIHTTAFNGTLLVLDRPSRFDLQNRKCLSEPARSFVASALGMRPGEFGVCYLDQTDSPMFRTAKRIIMAGPRCAEQFGNAHLDKLRGYVQVDGDVRTVFTYHPSDALDHGPMQYKEAEGEIDVETDDYGSTEKDGGVTKWSNFRQWFLLDIKKLLAASLPAPVVFERLYPSQDALLAWLRRPRKYLYADIECDPKTKTLWCIGVADDVDNTAISISIYRWDLKAIFDLKKVMFEFWKATTKCLQVYHNAAFDLAFLFIEYKFPINLKIEDTMCMHHRCYPELEKSLGHVGGLWTNEKWHKDTGGTWSPKFKRQYDNLLAYNVRDVVLMKAAHVAMHLHGPAGSIAKVNRNAGNYLRIGLTGIPIDRIKQIKHRARLELMLVQFRRVLTILVGYPLNCGSGQQLVNYLYVQKGYEVSARTDSGAPATDAKTLYALLAKYDNPALTVILRIKKDEKALAMMGFELIERKYYEETVR